LIEPALEKTPGQQQHALPQRRLQRFQIQIAQSLPTQQTFNLVEDFSREALGERSFF
jgi:hypothetical protein